MEEKQKRINWKKKYQELEIESNDHKNKYMYLLADFDNYKKRMESTKNLEIQQGINKVITDIIELIDLLIIARNNCGGMANYEGINNIINKGYSILNKYNVTPMDTKEGDMFDADYHEAISQIPVDDEKLNGHIRHIFKQGYMIGDKVLRYANVTVNILKDNK